MRGRGAKQNTIAGGIVLANKPEGLGSAALVAKLRKRLGGARVGHTGTLDRFASGLMILVVGRATSFADYFLARDKTYRAGFQFGVFTDTHDPVGEVEDRRSPEETRAFLEKNGERVRAALEDLVNRTSQVPPLYSAVKKEGKRFSDHAREGKRELPAERPIKVYSAVVNSLDPAAGLVSADFRVSSGTYVRSFARDISRDLNFPMHLARLKRLSIADFSLEDKRVWEPGLEEEDGEDARDANAAENEGPEPEIIPIQEGLPEWPLFVVSPGARADIKNGRRVPLNHGLSRGTDFFIADEDGRVLAWARSEGGAYGFRKVFSD